MKEQVSEYSREPLVSVIMPAYNSAAYIHRAITSVQNQTMPDWELLVIDDASTDETAWLVHILAKEDPRIKLHTNVVNKGTADSRNLGMELSRGSFIAFLDSDDIWHPQKLEQQIAFALQKHADLVCCAYDYINVNGKRSPGFSQIPKQITLEQMLQNNVIGCSTVLITREIAAQFRFSSQYHFEDYVFWLSMLQSGKQLYGITDVLVDYQIRKNSRSNSKLLCAIHRWRVYRQFLGFSQIKSFYYLIRYTAAGIRKHLSV